MCMSSLGTTACRFAAACDRLLPLAQAPCLQRAAQLAAHASTSGQFLTNLEAQEPVTTATTMPRSNLLWSTPPQAFLSYIHGDAGAGHDSNPSSKPALGRALKFFARAMTAVGLRGERVAELLHRLAVCHIRPQPLGCGSNLSCPRNCICLFLTNPSLKDLGGKPLCNVPRPFSSLCFAEQSCCFGCNIAAVVVGHSRTRDGRGDNSPKTVQPGLLRNTVTCCSGGGRISAVRSPRDGAPISCQVVA